MPLFLFGKDPICRRVVSRHQGSTGKQGRDASTPPGECQQMTEGEALFAKVGKMQGNLHCIDKLSFLAIIRRMDLIDADWAMIELMDKRSELAYEKARWKARRIENIKEFESSPGSEASMTPTGLAARVSESYGEQDIGRVDEDEASLRESECAQGTMSKRGEGKNVRLRERVTMHDAEPRAKPAAQPRRKKYAENPQDIPGRVEEYQRSSNKASPSYTSSTQYADRVRLADTPTGANAYGTPTEGEAGANGQSAAGESHGEQNSKIVTGETGGED
jgi:hypothetical protein